MSLLETLRIAFGGLRNNVMRSLLTILGVIIGVTSVIVIVAIGDGARNQVTQRIQSLGSNMLIISPGRTRDTGRSQGAFGSANVLTDKVVAALQEKVASAVAVAPESRGNRMVSYAGTVLPTNVTGITPDYAQVRNVTLQAGEFFTEADNKAKRRLAILGPSVAAELFGEDDPIGKEIKIDNARFKVIGLSAAKGQSGMNNQDDVVYVPFQTAQRRIFGTQYIRTIYLQVDENVKMDYAIAELQEVLAEFIEDPEGYNISSQEEIQQTMEETAKTFTMLLAGIASVSLLVGGIGIMNIMLVSVTERIREIGLRKAIGARRVEILLQFLSEAVILSLAGGILGLLMGILGAALASRLMQMPMMISVNAVVLALAFSVAVGLFFGVYPANKASMLHPIEALRHE